MQVSGKTIYFISVFTKGSSKMRTFVKEEIHNQIGTLIRAMDALMGVFFEANYEKAVLLISQIQETTIQLGTWAEKYIGEDHYFIRQLETICELLYEINENICDTDMVMKDIKCIKDSYETVCNKIGMESSSREILFLPYQVSMWDSLESVWMAAKDDPQLDCYVMPIPYYDVLPDGKLGQFHYDGDKYPDYVPITNYELYSIEERCPDMIFFHNPYDGNNAVTRIPEQYYSSHIKDYTGMLVYIPYMVSDVWGPAEHQCYTPGVLFADRVITQQDPVYSRYCKGYTNAIREADLESCFIKAEEKFLPLGSPKLDKIMHTKVTIEDVPLSWKRKIVKEDGTLKKIVLYNLSIGTLLTHGEDVLVKARDVFRLIEAQKSDIVIIWRPHPLLLHTIDAMRPQLKNRYIQLISDFKKGQWGIFDDTSDPNMAMSIADAYYGDDSSLVPIYKVTGKPILYQNMTPYFREKKKVYVLSYRAFYIEADQIWFSSDNINGIFRGNLATQQVEYVGKIPNEYESAERLYSACLSVGNTMIFIPDYANEISIYNRDTNEMKKIPLRKLELNAYTMYSKFTDYIRQGDVVWLVPYRYKYIAKLNIQTLELQDVCNWYEVLYQKQDIACRVQSYSLLTNDILELVLKDENGMISHLQFDLRKEEMISLVQETTKDKEWVGVIDLKSMRQAIGNSCYQYDFEKKQLEQVDLSGRLLNAKKFAVDDVTLKNQIWSQLMTECVTNVWWESDFFQLSGVLTYSISEKKRKKHVQYKNVGTQIYEKLIKTDEF